MRFSKAYLCLLKGSYMEKELAPPPGFLPGESRDGGAWWAAVCGAAQSRTRLKQRSSSSSSMTVYCSPCFNYTIK